jgi:hypothetical protein
MFNGIGDVSVARAVTIGSSPFRADQEAFDRRAKLCMVTGIVPFDPVATAPGTDTVTRGSYRYGRRQSVCSMNSPAVLGATSCQVSSSRLVVCKTAPVLS